MSRPTGLYILAVVQAVTWLLGGWIVAAGTFAAIGYARTGYTGDAWIGVYAVSACTQLAGLFGLAISIPIVLAYRRGPVWLVVAVLCSPLLALALGGLMWLLGR